MTTGEQSGTWGTKTNTNLELIGEALGFGTQAITTNADTFASTIGDATSDKERAIYIKYTGALDSNCTITIGPNVISRLHFIENATTDSGSSGPYSIIISQGSGANVTIPNGDTKAVYLDGAGSGAAVVDAFASLSVVDLKVQDDLSLTSDSAVLNIGAGNDLKITHDGTNGDFESAGNLTFDVAGDINLDAGGAQIILLDDATEFGQIYNSSNDLAIYSSISDADLRLQGNDGGVLTTALLLDMSVGGSATFSHNVKLPDSGVLGLGAGGDLNLISDGTNGTMSAPNGNLTIDVAGDITLDAGGNQIRFFDSGTEIGLFGNENSDFAIVSSVQDKDIIFQGNDGGAGVTALTLDMSDAGSAIFNHNVKLPDNGIVALGAGTDLSLSSNGTNGTIAAPNGTLLIDVAGDISLDAGGAQVIFLDDGTEFGQIYKSGDDLMIYSAVSDGDLKLQGNDGGSLITALTFDMSEGGRASLNAGASLDISGILIYSGVGNDGIAIQTTASGAHNYNFGNFRNSSGTRVGRIIVGQSGTTYSVSSDYRLKENVSYSFDATSRLKQLKPARFNFIVDADTTVDGFLAHEVSSIVPEAVQGEKDATESMTNVVLNADGTRLTDDVTQEKWVAGKLSTTDEDGNTVDPIYASDTTWVASQTVPDYQSIDQAKLVPLLVKTIQELEARITALESA